MICEIQAAGTIELYFYGELAIEERAGVQAHLKQCAECRQAFEDLSVIRAALATRPDVATPPGGDWSGFMIRLDAALKQSATVTARADGSTRVPAMPVRRRLVPALAMAALLALVTFSVVLVLRQHNSVVIPGDRQPPGTASAPPAAESTVQAADPFVTLSDAHFERSKLVVLGLATKDSSALNAADWSYERDAASSLLRDTRLYRAAAEERGLSTLAGVMRDLELVLLQTSMAERPDPASLQQLQRLIQRRDLITKMNVMAAAGP